jgi:hypothetical protein
LAAPRNRSRRFFVWDRENYNMESPEQTLPTLLYLLCAMSAMAFLVSSYKWLWRVATHHVGEAVPFDQELKIGQFYTFLAVMMLSIVIGAYNHILYQTDLDVFGECAVLASVILYAYYKADADKKAKAAIGVMRGAVTYFLFCALGWLLTFALGVSLTHLFNLFGLMGPMALNPQVVFITGLLWNAPIIFLYFITIRDAEKKQRLHGYAFHKFLFPVFLAYTVLLVPLLIQQISVSKEWQQMKYEKPVRTV